MTVNDHRKRETTAAQAFDRRSWWIMSDFFDEKLQRRKKSLKA